MEIEIGGEKAGRLEIGLFGDVVPKTVQNFIQLHTHAKVSTVCFRIVLKDTLCIVYLFLIF